LYIQSFFFFSFIKVEDEILYYSSLCDILNLFFPKK